VTLATDRHPCKSFVKRKHKSPEARAPEIAHTEHGGPAARMCASRRWFLPTQNQTSISLSRARKACHRRLSVCSLPVLKQSGGSLVSLISVAQSVSGRTWQSARCVIAVLFLVGAVLRPRRVCDLLQARSPVLLDPRQADTRPSSALRRESLDWQCLSVSLFHRATLDHDPAWVPTSPLPLAMLPGNIISRHYEMGRASFVRHSLPRSKGAA
jgi:hypothetical protein